MTTQSATTRRCSSSVWQSLSSDRLYTSLLGSEVHTGGAASPDGFYALTWKPWLLQVQEQGDDGVWRLVTHQTFMRKADALADAARQGIDLDYVSHHDDYVRGVAIVS